MAELLYLDMARLGRMSATARLAHQHFVDLAGEEGASLHFERFLQFGWEAFPRRAQARYPALEAWQGIGRLKQTLRELAGSRPDLPVLVANRSAQLMKFAARLLFHPCRNVLVTDVGWPGYHAILQSECRCRNRSATVVPVCREILSVP